MLKLSWSWDLDGLIIAGSTLPRLKRAGVLIQKEKEGEAFWAYTKFIYWDDILRRSKLFARPHSKDKRFRF